MDGLLADVLGVDGDDLEGGVVCGGDVEGGFDDGGVGGGTRCCGVSQACRSRIMQPSCVILTILLIVISQRARYVGVAKPKFN